MSRRRAGFSALEVMFALAILTVGILSLLSAISAANALAQHNREEQVALRALNQRLEQLRGRAPSDIIAAIEAAAPEGPTQEVDEAADPTLGTELDLADPARPARRRVLRAPRLVLAVLDEEEAAKAMGLGAPLDLDGGAPGSDRGAYVVAPVLATLTWQGAGGATVTRSVFTMFYPSTAAGP